MGCNSDLKYLIDLARKDLLDDYDKTVSAYYAEYMGALEKLKSNEAVKDLGEFNFSSLVSTVSKQVKNIGADISSGAVWLIFQIIQKTGKLLPRLLVAYALIQLKEQLKSRRQVMSEITVQLNVISTCIKIVEINLRDYDPDDVSLVGRILTAKRYVRDALIRTRQFMSIWEATGVFHDGIFRQILANLNSAQDNLIVPQLNTYKDALEEKLRENEFYGGLENEGIIEIDSILTALAGSLDPSKPGVRALIALEPLFIALNNGYDDRASKIVFAFRLGLQAILEIAKITPYNPTIIFSILKANGHVLAAGPAQFFDGVEGDDDYYARYVDSELDTLLELNGAINNKIQALQNIEEKYLSLKQITSPMVQYIDESTFSLRAIHDDMKETLETVFDNKELFGKSSAWSNEISNVQGKLQILPPIGTEFLDEATFFVQDWNTILNIIDEYDTTDNAANNVYTNLFLAILQMPVALSSRNNYKNVLHRINLVKNQIEVADIRDRNMIDILDDLDLERIEGLKIVESLIDYADAVFPLLGEILRNSDIEKLNKALDQVKSAYSSGITDTKNALKDVGRALKWVVQGDKTKQIEECFTEMGIEFNLTFKYGGEQDEEDSRSMKDFENFEAKRRGQYERLDTTVSPPTVDTPQTSEIDIY